MKELSEQTPIEQLTHIMETLRSKQGCPWDQEQTLESLKPNLIEESHEVLEAIDRGDRKHLKEGLDDLLLQVVFQSQICKEEGHFSFNDVVHGINEKLIRRHPHVFGDVKASNADEALKSWETMKKRESPNTNRSIIDGIPPSLPALHKAQKVQKK